MLELEKYSFDATGVAIVRGLIPQEQIDTALTAVRNNWENGPPWKFPVLHLGRVFWEWMTHPYVLELCREFAGDHFRMDHAFGVSGRGAISQLHGGPQSSQYSCFYMPLPNSERKGLAGQLNFGITLVGQTPATGGFCYIPGSHKAAEPRAGAEILAEIYRNKFNHHSIVIPQLNPGDFMLFTEGVVHGDTGWLAKKDPHRMQIYYKMTPGWMCWRDPAQNLELNKYAETELERRLISPPWTGRYTEDEFNMGIDNERRKPTIQ